jgi:hypothetical protein
MKKMKKLPIPQSLELSILNKHRKANFNLLMINLILRLKIYSMID